jgi:hypothetical protein
MSLPRGQLDGATERGVNMVDKVAVQARQNDLMVSSANDAIRAIRDARFFAFHGLAVQADEKAAAVRVSARNAASYAWLSGAAVEPKELPDFSADPEEAEEERQRFVHDTDSEHRNDDAPGCQYCRANRKGIDY